MLGIKSSGCFIIGIVTGFILALSLVLICVCYFSPSIKAKTIDRVEAYWKNIKNGVDNSIDAAKRAPTAEPVIPMQYSGEAQAPQQSTYPKQPTPATAPAPAPAKRPLVEIKLGI